MATIWTNRAATYFNQKRYDEARADLERQIDIREHTIGLAHPDSLPAINNLAAVLRAAGMTLPPACTSACWRSPSRRSGPSIRTRPCSSATSHS
ncbi:MAG: tetratricopeptide repeat protein [Planctomycetota bacterium]